MQFSFDFKRNFVPLLALFVLLLVLMPRGAKFNYDYRKGTAWEYDDLVAEFDFPILKSLSELQAERLRPAAEAVPYFVCDLEAEQRHIDSLAARWPFLLSRTLKEEFLGAVSAVYRNGVVPEDAFDPAKHPVIYVERSKKWKEASLETAHSPLKLASSNVMTPAQARSYVLRQIEMPIEGLGLDSLYAVMGIPELMTPNLRYDEVMTELVRSEQSGVVSPTLGIVHFGDRIVQRGELITDDVLRVLDSYRTEYEARMGALGGGRLEWAGHGIMALALVILFYFSILYSNPRILPESNRFLYLCLVFAIASVATFLIERLDPGYLYLVPFTLTTLYLVAFFKWRVVLPVYVVSLLPLLIFAHGGMELFFMFLVGGVVTMFAFKFFNRGWQQFLTAFIAFCAMALVYLGFRAAGLGSPCKPEYWLKNHAREALAWIKYFLNHDLHIPIEWNGKFPS